MNLWEVFRDVRCMYCDLKLCTLTENGLLICTLYTVQVHVLQLMNDRLTTGFTEAEILDIFCDVCEGKVRKKGG